MLLWLGLTGGCALFPAPAPLHDEQAVGAPLPYEPPLAGMQVAPALPAVAPEVVKNGPRRKRESRSPSTPARLRSQACSMKM